MQEKLIEKTSNLTYSDNNEPDSSVDSMHESRNQFTNKLVDKGLIRQEFAQSGYLDRFNFDEQTGVDALKHILVGSSRGGLHHVPTLIGIDSGGAAVSSVISNASQPEKPLSRFIRAQRAEHGMSFKSESVQLGEGNGKSFYKDRGSTMFPNEWSTEKVISAIVHTANQPGLEYVDYRNDIRVKHLETIDNVRLTVITLKKTGKILSAFPR